MLSVNNNTADYEGGGIWIGSHITFVNFGEMNLQNNNATIAGGIVIAYGSSFVSKGQLRVIGNTATSAGGGIVFDFDAFIILQKFTS